MTIAPDYRELHQAVDRLTPAQAEALFVVVESITGHGDEQTSRDRKSEPRRRHRLSFTGSGSGPADLAERADEYLRSGAFGAQTA